MPVSMRALAVPVLGACAQAVAAAFAPDGRLLVLGAAHGDADFGGGVEDADSGDVFVSSLDP
ncbi:MAG TPA: hypothetical protein VHB21_12385 [Minicystis sp.]|nr:hypothetical protein [Minicystis sp.]